MKVHTLEEVFNGGKIPDRINLDIIIKAQDAIAKFKITDSSGKIVDLELESEKPGIAQHFLVGNHLR